jgi:hypothetical protein
VYSNWASCRQSKWKKTLTQAFGSTHVIESTYVSTHTMRKCTLSFADRCTPAISFSTCGMLYTLARWGYLTREAGGLGEPHAAQNAQQLFMGALSTVQSHAGGLLTVEVFLDNDWTPSWPRPPARDCPSFQVVVDECGLVHLEGLRVVAMGSHRGTIATKWWLAFKRHVHREATMAFGCLLNTGKAQHVTIAQQVIYALACRLESALAVVPRATADDDGGATALTLEWTTGCGNGSKHAEVDLQLAQYILASKGAVGRPQFFSHAIDKGNPARLPLYLGVLATPQNVAVCCAPQVDPRHALGPQPWAPSLSSQRGFIAKWPPNGGMMEI